MRNFSLGNMLKINNSPVLKFFLSFLAENLPKITSEFPYNFYTSETIFSENQTYFTECDSTLLKISTCLLGWRSLT